MGKDARIGSVELISELIKNATLSKKEKERIKREIENEEDGGKGTIWLKSWKEYDEVANKCKGGLTSPGTASAAVGLSRARIHQLENEGKIRVYRISADDEPYTEADFREELKILPYWVRPFITFKKPRAGSYAFVDMDDLRRYVDSQRGKDD